MGIPEGQLDTWSKQGSVTQSASTYSSVKGVLDDDGSPYYQRDFDNFLQGSYGNDTNIYADSDVDIVMRLKSVYYSDTSLLEPDDLARYERAFVKASYSLSEFKSEVLAWLKKGFGEGVKAGKKAIYVPGNQYRRDADVLPCAQHRWYTSYPEHGGPSYHEGIMFETADGKRIVNYPKQHSANSTTKHQNTAGYFKPAVRIIKNMRNRMKADGLIEDGLAPSYFIEGLLSNVPDRLYGRSYESTMVNAINFIQQTDDKSQWTCANGIHWLLRDGFPTSWPPANYQRFMRELVSYWNKW